MHRRNCCKTNGQIVVGTGHLNGPTKNHLNAPARILVDSTAFSISVTMLVWTAKKNGIMEWMKMEENSTMEHSDQHVSLSLCLCTNLPGPTNAPRGRNENGREQNEKLECEEREKQEVNRARRSDEKKGQ